MSRADLAISIPASWRRASEPGCGVIVHARAPSLPDSGVRPEVVLRCEPVEEEPSRWRRAALVELESSTVKFDLEDEDDYDLGGLEVTYRRYAHHLRGVDVLCDEWSWLVDGLGLVLTCSVAREDYLDYYDVFEAIAATVDPGPP